MRRILMLIACGACAISAFAGERTDDEMMRIALSKLNSANLVKSMSGGAPSAKHVQQAFSTDNYTIFAGEENSGFVIVSRKDSYPAVIGYAAGAFDATQMPCCMKWWLNGLDRQMASSQKAPRHSTRAGGYTPVAPFITTKWSQGDPFNRKTPTIKSENTPVGCVATAMAQCMNYCQWPKSAKFDSFYYLAKSDKQHEVSVSSSYSWPYMDGYGYFYKEGYTDHSDVTYVDPGRKGNLVAQLCADCGYAVHMQYDADGSGAYNFETGVALIDNFSYPEASVKYAERAFCSEDEWMAIISEEMQRRCPIIYGGQDDKFGGHAFVFGGMDADGLVYVNWGWRGEFDGFYDVSLLNPEGYKFSEGQDMVYGIRKSPLPTDKAQPRIYSYDGTPYTFSVKEEKGDDGKMHFALHIRFQRGMVNFSTTTMDGEFGLFGSDITDNCNWQVVATDSDTWEPLTGYYLKEPSDLYYYYLEDDLIPGHTYRISFGSRDKEEGEWHSVLCEGGEVGYEIHYTGKAATTTISERMDPLVVGIRHTIAYVPVANDVTRVYDTQGRLIFTAPTQQFRWDDVKAKGIVIVRQGEKVWKVMR